MTQPSWYLIYTNPRQEDRTDQNLKAWKVETFAPKIREPQLNPFTGKPTTVIKPLFPRYIFARFPLASHLHKIRFTRGVQGVVSFGDGPTAVDQGVIDFLRSRVKQDGFVPAHCDFEPGERVLVQGGPFSGLTGIFNRETQDADRVRILLETVSFQAHITIERAALQKV